MCLYACTYQNNKTPPMKTDKWIFIALFKGKMNFDSIGGWMIWRGEIAYLNGGN